MRRDYYAMRRALVAGSSGAVGQQLLTRLVESDVYSDIHCLVRKPSGISHTKIHEHVIDFESLDDFKWPENIHDVFCCLGTTRKKAGSAQNFRRVDCDYVLSLGQLARKNNITCFSVISSMSVNSRWGGLYLDTKRAMESGLKDIGFPHLQIFRPSLLKGQRKDVRPGELLAAAILDPLCALPIARLQQLKPVSTHQVAMAMAQKARSPEHPLEIIGNRAIRQIS